MDFSQPMSAISGSNTSLPGRSTNQQKCEQVMFECVQKVAEIIVQSRLAFPRSQIGRKGRVRFNLEIDEVDFLRRLMEPWGMDPHLPLCIDMFWQGQAAAAAATTHHPQHQQQQQQQPPRALLERWNVTYAPLPSAPGGDALAQLRHVCKRIVILLRTLYSFTRVLPAHQLHRRLQAARAGGRGGSGGGGSGGGGGEDIGFCLGVRTGGSGLEFARHVATREYRFEPLDTPYGTLTLATAYRRSLAELCVAPAPPLTAPASTPLLESDTIIVDYMQQQAAAAAAARPMSGLGAQLHAHGVQRRRHADPGEGFSHSQSPHVGGASSKHYAGSGLGGITEGLAHDRFAQPAPWYRPGTSPVPIPHSGVGGGDGGGGGGGGGGGQVIGHRHSIAVEVGHSRSLDTGAHQGAALMARHHNYQQRRHPHADRRLGAQDDEEEEGEERQVPLTAVAAPYGYGAPVPSAASPPTSQAARYMPGGGVMAAAPPTHADTPPRPIAAAAAAQQQQQPAAPSLPSSLPAPPSLWPPHRRHTMQGYMPLVKEMSRETSGGSAAAAAAAAAAAGGGMNAGESGGDWGMGVGGTPPTHSTPPFSFRTAHEGVGPGAFNLEQPVVSFSPPFTVAPIAQLAAASEAGSIVGAQAARSVLALTPATQTLESLPESPFLTSMHAAASAAAAPPHHYAFAPPREAASFMAPAALFTFGGGGGDPGSRLVSRARHNTPPPPLTSASVPALTGAHGSGGGGGGGSGGRVMRGSLLASAVVLEGDEEPPPFAVTADETAVQSMMGDASAMFSHAAQRHREGSGAGAAAQGERGRGDGGAGLAPRGGVEGSRSVQMRRTSVQSLEEELDAFRSFAKELIGP